MSRVLMVSKPIVPPWNDSSKNLVRDVSTHLRRHRPTIMTRGDDRGVPAGVAHAAVYPPTAGGFSPALADNARVVLRLLRDRQHDLWHFFFAPNPRSASAGRVCARLRRIPTVQSVCSAPAAGADISSLLFADRTVVLSRHTESLVLDAGVPRSRVRRIPPAVAPLTPMPPDQRGAARARLGLPEDRPLIVYPGDLEFSAAAARMLRAHAQRWRAHGAWLVMACRAKTVRAAERERALRELSASLGLDDVVTWLGETPDIHTLLGCADVVALPAETLYAKMDLPLVLIEAMLLAVAAVVGAGTPAAELADRGGALAVPPETEAVAEAVAALIEQPARRAALGAAGRTHALACFAPARIAEAYEDVYDELLHERTKA